MLIPGGIFLSQSNGLDGLAGTYTGSVMVRDAPTMPDADRYIKIHLNLGSDRHFVFDLENHTMFSQTEHASGLFRREGDEVVIEGTSDYTMDDGYVKTAGKRGFMRRLSIEHGSLILYSAPDSAIVFCRPGSARPSTFPVWQKPASDPRALMILATVRKRYSLLKSYRDDADFSSLGDTETPKRASLSFRFVRQPRRFLFRVVVMHPPIPQLTNEIGTDATGSWFYKKGYNRDLEKREAAMSFGTVSAGADSWAIYSMLTVAEGFSTKSDSAHVLEEPDENVDKHPCFKIVFRGIEGSEVSLWIDRSSHLIRRYKDGSMGQEVHHRPEANVTIPNSELKLRKTQIRGAG